MSDKLEYTIRCPVESELALVQALRHEVLDPDRIIQTDTSLSQCDYNEKTIHMAAYVGDDLVSTVRINSVHDDRGTHCMVEKMATHPAYRNQGIGAHVLEAAELAAAQKGAVYFGLDSRQLAIPFYARQGYTDTGLKVDNGDGVPNFRMVKRVRL